MNLQSLVILLFTIALAGCANTLPNNKTDILSDIKVKLDPISQSAIISTPFYPSIQTEEKQYPITISYIAQYENDELASLTLHVISNHSGWGSYKTAIDEKGNQLTLKRKEGGHSFAGQIVETQEHFDLVLSRQYLENIANRDLDISVYGVRNREFTIPAILSQGFLKKLNCYESATCS